MMSGGVVSARRKHFGAAPERENTDARFFIAVAAAEPTPAPENWPKKPPPAPPAMPSSDPSRSRGMFCCNRESELA